MNEKSKERKRLRKKRKVINYIKLLLLSTSSFWIGKNRLVINTDVKVLQNQKNKKDPALSFDWLTVGSPYNHFGQLMTITINRSP